jgi:hypothetical protein
VSFLSGVRCREVVRWWWRREMVMLLRCAVVA